MKFQQLKEILGQFKDKNILVVGDVGIDRYIHGTTSRLSAEAPVPIFIEESREDRPGLAANVTANLVALGAKVRTVGVVGIENSQYLRKILGTDLILDTTRPTTIKERYCVGTHHLLRVDTESTRPIEWGNTECLVLNQLESLCKANSFNAIIMQDYQKGVLTPHVAELIHHLAKTNSTPIFVDPNLKANPDLYLGATVITPNQQEAEVMADVGKIGKNLENLDLVAQKIIERTKCEYVVITLGAKGMAIYREDWPSAITIPSKAKAVFDVCGAGDTVIAALTLAFCSHDQSGALTSMEEATHVANLAAAIKVSKFGTSVVTTGEILASLSD